MKVTLVESFNSKLQITDCFVRHNRNIQFLKSLSQYTSQHTVVVNITHTSFTNNTNHVPYNFFFLHTINGETYFSNLYVTFNDMQYFHNHFITGKFYSRANVLLNRIYLTNNTIGFFFDLE